MRTAEQYAELAMDSLHKSAQGTHEFTMTTLIQAAQVFATLAQMAATRELADIIQQASIDHYDSKTRVR